MYENCGTEVFYLVMQTLGPYLVKMFAGLSWDRHAAQHGKAKDSVRFVGEENSGLTRLLCVAMCLASRSKIDREGHGCWSGQLSVVVYRFIDSHP